MKPELIRAARAGLNWTQKRLADEAGINRNSVRYWECGIGGSTREPNAVPKIEAALTRAGVRFTGNTVTLPE